MQLDRCIEYKSSFAGIYYQLNLYFLLNLGLSQVWVHKQDVRLDVRERKPTILFFHKAVFSWQMSA